MLKAGWSSRRERDRVKSYARQAAATVCDINKQAGELSTDEVNKKETVLKNSCQFKIPAHMLNRNSASEGLDGQQDPRVRHK